MGAWKNPAKELPEPGMYVLVWTSFFNHLIKRQCKAFDIDFVNKDTMRWEKNTNAVIAWTELPKPPKEDKL